MKSSLPRRALFFLPLACAALYGCPPAETETDPGDEYADVVYGGAATDEAMVALGSALDQKAPVEDPSRAPVLDTPSGGELPASPIPEFSWHFGESASHRAPSRVPALRFTEVSAPPAPALLRVAAPDAAPAWPAALLSLLGPPRAAHAHGDPLNGTATLLVFSTADDPKLVRIFTDQTSFTPGDEIWSKLKGAGKQITLSLIAAEFEQNRIADGGDPVQGTKVTFTIAAE